MSPVRFQAPKGVPDYLPPRSAALLAVREAMSRPLRLAGYGHAELPVFEDTELFARGVGESTDVVSKEMYTFADRGGRSVTLRPEGTAGVLRALLEHGLDRGGLPVKLWYAGPMFRYERPQAGRLRQLQQVGAEAVGSDDPALDAELVWLAATAFAELGLRRCRLRLGTLGDAVCRPAYRDKLVEFLAGLDLDAETRRRAATNPLRVLDDKRPQVRAQLSGVPVLVDHLCDSCRTHYDAVRGHLADLGVAYDDDALLVRGLDYYTRTVFEFEHDGLGAQSVIGAGGRYDGLAETLGGPALPGIGWALGVDRTLLALDAEGLDPGAAPVVDVIAVPIGVAAKRLLVLVVGDLRRGGIAADLAYAGPAGERGLKGAMKAADRSGARLAVLLGDREVAAGAAQLRDLSARDQQEVPLADLVATIRSRLGR